MHIDTFAIGLLLLSNILLFASGNVTGPLKVSIKSASDLPDEDGWWNLSDPYVVVFAYIGLMEHHQKNTDDVSGN